MILSLLFTACYPKISENDLPKTCTAAKDAVLTAEYFLEKKFGDKIFEQRPYQFERNETNDVWLIRGFIERLQLGGPYHAEVRMNDCTVLKLYQEE